MSDYRIRTVLANNAQQARQATGGKAAMIVRHTGPGEYTLFRRTSDAMGHPSSSQR